MRSVPVRAALLSISIVLVGWFVVLPLVGRVSDARIGAREFEAVEEVLRSGALGPGDMALSINALATRTLKYCFTTVDDVDYAMLRVTRGDSELRIYVADTRVFAAERLDFSSHLSHWYFCDPQKLTEYVNAHQR